MTIKQTDLPRAARLEDGAHRADAGRYLNGTIYVTHIGLRLKSREGLMGMVSGEKG